MGKGNLNVEERNEVGNHVRNSLGDLLQNNTEAKMLEEPYQWFIAALDVYVPSLQTLWREIGEDKKLRKLQLELPEQSARGFDLCYQALHVVLLKAQMGGEAKHLEAVELAIEDVTRGLSRSEVSTSLTKQLGFLEHFVARLADHPVLHYKDENIDLVDEANTLLALMQEASKDLHEELRETREARDNFWKAAATFDREYQALKHAARSYLTHTDQLDKMKNLFLDLDPSWQPKRSTQTENPPNS